MKSIVSSIIINEAAFVTISCILIVVLLYLCKICGQSNRTWRCLAVLGMVVIFIIITSEIIMGVLALINYDPSLPTINPKAYEDFAHIIDGFLYYHNSIFGNQTIDKQQLLNVIWQTSKKNWDKWISSTSPEFVILDKNKKN